MSLTQAVVSLFLLSWFVTAELYAAAQLYWIVRYKKPFIPYKSKDV